MKLGSTVRLIYTGTLDDGTVFGTATAEEPMEFQTGMDLTIPGFEKEILEMSEVGEKRSFKVGQYDAYGEYLEDFVEEVPISNVPVKVEVGKRIWMLDDDGNRFPVTVKEIRDETVVFDMNHPLAGQDLNFEVEIIGLEDAPENFVSAAERKKQIEKQNRAMGFGNDSGPETVVM
jgi:peptidylprolyl isomerase